MKKSEAHGLRDSNVGAVSVIPQQGKHANCTGSSTEETAHRYGAGSKFVRNSGANVANLRAQREASKAKKYGENTRATTKVKESGELSNVETLRARREAAKAKDYGNEGRGGDNSSTAETSRPLNNSMVEDLRTRREVAKAGGQPLNQKGVRRENTVNTTKNPRGKWMTSLLPPRQSMTNEDEYTHRDLTESENTAHFDIPTEAHLPKHGLRISSGQQPHAQQPGAQFVVSQTRNAQANGTRLLKGLRRHPKNNIEQPSAVVCDQDEYGLEIANKRTTTSDGLVGTATWCVASGRYVASGGNVASGRYSNDNELLVNASGDEKGNTLKRKVKCLVASLVLIIIVVVVVSIKVGQRRKDSGEESSAEKSYLDFEGILPNYTKISLLNPASPQSTALKWLRSDPLLTSYTNSQKLRKFALATFFFSTSGGIRSSWENTDSVIQDKLNECPLQNSTQNSVSFCNYKELILTNSDLQGGTIPLELGLLTTLQRIKIRENSIIGSIPSQIGCLTDLQEFDVGNNSLTGTIPSEIGFLTNVEIINMENNYLTGTIPAILFEIDSNHSLSKLSEIYLQNNTLGGTLPTEIGSLTSLKNFDISFNNVEGAIPSQIGFVNTTTILLMRENSLVGSIPTELGHLQNIVRFEIQGNDLTGTIPSELGLWTNGKALEINLERNSLTGTLPSEIGLLSSMRNLNVSLNHLTGTIPSEVGLLYGAIKLDFSSNNFSGSIPPEIGRLDIYRLYLQNNSFTGTLPTELGSMTLAIIDISNNTLTGVIPPEIGNMYLLQEFLAHSNSLSGTLPTALGNLDMVVLLSLYDNNFTGPIPSELGRALSLQQVFLFENSLTGTIPTGVCFLRENGWLEELVVDCSSVDCICGCTCHESMGNE